MRTGKDLLLEAARKGDRTTVEKISNQISKRKSFRRAPDVNVRDIDGLTPLHHASLNGHREIVQQLLSVGASPCSEDNDGNTPLHLAAFNNFTVVARILLAHNNPPVNIDHLNLKFETALLIAAKAGYDDFVALMICRGADVSIKNFNDESALDLAAQYNRVNTVKLLVEQHRTSLNRGNNYQSKASTPFHIAVKYGHIKVVIALLEAGINPNIRSVNGTPLHVGASFARADVVRELLRRGADLKAQDKSGKTVYDVLSVLPVKESKHVLEVLREFMSHQNMKKNLPLPPVARDNNNTAHVFNLAKTSPSFSLVTNQPAYLQEKDNFQEKEVLKALPKPLPKISTLQTYSNDIADSTRVTRTNSFLTKADTHNNEVVVSKARLNHCDLLSELRNRHFNVIKSINPNPKSENIEKSNLCIWPDLNSEHVLRPQKLDSINKKKPIPSPKPKVKHNIINQNEVGKAQAHYQNASLQKQLNNLLLSSTTNDEFQDSNYENSYCGNIFQNADRKSTGFEKHHVQIKNMPDDVKEKMACAKPENEYLVMVARPQCRNLTIDRTSVKTFSSSSDYVNYDPSLVIHNRSERIKSTPDSLEFKLISKPCSMHMKGIPGCDFENKIEHEYIYELNHATIRQNIPPFIRKRVTESNMPCYCKDLSDYQKYYSCEKLDELESEYGFVEDDVKTPNASIIEEVNGTVPLKSLNREPELNQPTKPSVDENKLIGIAKKKVSQITNFFGDW